MDDKILFPIKNEYTANVENIALSLFTYNRCINPSERVDSTLHVHPFSEIFSCTEGKVYIHTDSQIITLNPGDIAIVPSGIHHDKLEDENDDKGWCSFLFKITKKARKNTSDLFSMFTPILSAKSILTARNVIDICKELADIENIDESYVPALRFTTLLTKLVTSGLTSVTEGFDLSNRQDGFEDLDRLVKLDHILNHYYTSNITSAQVAEILFISQRQLSRTILKRYGAPFKQILLDRRLTVAENLLLKTDKKICDISREIGFPSLTAFHHAFKNRHGMTPLEYRKTH